MGVVAKLSLVLLLALAASAQNSTNEEQEGLTTESQLASSEAIVPTTDDVSADDDDYYDIDDYDMVADEPVAGNESDGIQKKKRRKKKKVMLVPYENRPQLHPMGDQHEVNTSETWTVRCAGRHPVSWDLPMDEKAQPKLLSKRVTIDHEVIPGHNTRPYISHLTVKDVQYHDTGYYYCRYNGTVTNDVFPNVTSTYVYALHDKYLFPSPSRLSWVNVMQYAETVLPCKPTDPSVQMKFLKTGQGDITNDLESKFFKYDPKRGLIVTRGTQQHHSGMLQCVATRPSDNFTETIHVIMQFQPVQTPPPPLIVQPVTDPLFVGEGVRLDCQLPLDRGMPHIELVWGFPQGEEEVDEALETGRIVVGPQNRSRISEEDFLYSISADGIMISRSVDITNLRIQDKGVYTCKAVLAGTDEASPAQEYHLANIHSDPTEPRIHSTKVEGHPLITVDNSTHRIRWVLSVDTYPEPGLTWLHPTGREIDYTQLTKYEMDMDDKTDVVKLSIDHVTLEDTGEYLLNVEVKAEEGDKVVQTDVRLVLEVMSGPEVTVKVEDNMEDDLEYKLGLHKSGEEFKLTCIMRGYPLDTNEHRWTFKECPKSYSDCASVDEEQPDSAIEFLPSDGNVNKTYHYEYTSELSVVSNRSGVYTCHICTRFDPIRGKQAECVKESVNFFVTDAEPGFKLEGPKKSVIEEDRVGMKCSGSIYEFKSVTWLKQSKKAANQWNPLEVGGRSLTSTTTAFSHVSSIDFSKITRTDGAMYKCRGVYLDTAKGIEEKNFGVTVRNIEPPTKVKGNNMNGTEISAMASEEVVFNCSTQGVPTPTVEWFKDSEHLDPAFIGNATTLEFSSNGHVLRILFASMEDSGVYLCTSRNRGGTISSSMTLRVKQNVPLSKGLVIGIAGGILLLLMLSCVLCWKMKVYNRKYKELTKVELQMFEAGDPTSINPELGVDDQADLLPYNREFEFPRERLRLGKQLGAGAFGRVLKAHAQGIVSWERSTVVAVKMVKPHADITYIRALMAELKIMIHLGKHLNIVNLLGASTSTLNKRELLVIVEYCRFGNIQKYLMLHRNHYINQIDPETCEINFTIGQDIIENHGNDLARVREEDEMSAAYRRRLQSISTTGGGMDTAGNNSGTCSPMPEGYVDTTAGAMALPLEEGEMKLANGELPSPTSQCGAAANRLKPPRQSSIRYTSEPSQMPRRNRQVSIQSDYNDGLDVQVNTDMTTVTETEGSPSFDRSLSTKSTASQQGPGWRANMKGDYDVQTIRPICTKDLIGWSYQVARGMEYLASKKVMHGDLACRNILLAADNVVKICDFGLAKDIYKTSSYRKKTDGPLPIKWMAMESLGDRVFSTQSDVWSFGVVLWEMFAMGKTPYPGIEPSAKFYDMLLKGYRMEKPAYCPRIVYRTMIDCWNADPSNRPSFKNLMDFFGDLLEDGEKDHYLDLSKRFAKTHNGGDAPDAAKGVTNMNYLLMMQAPDYTTQMSIQTPDVEEFEDGYLMPRRPSHPLTPTIKEEDESGYLMPSTTSKDSGTGEEMIEMQSLVLHRDNGNIVKVVDDNKKSRSGSPEETMVATEAV